MRSSFLLAQLAAFLCLSIGLVYNTIAIAGNEGPVYQNPQAPVEARVQDVVQRLTVEEKVALLSGDTTHDMPGFETSPIPRLGIPSIKMNDGPLGVRFGNATSFPSGILLSASFDPELVFEVSKAIAEETKANGHNMLLGPCIDISRQPFGGRNFESYGEDPYLTSEMATHYVKGIQSEGVLASTKHFALNDQEYKRMTINVIADERTMQEIHLPAFHAAVEAGTYTIMASYNLLNGLHASENPALLTNILKRDWGFQGFVVSDWSATHSTVAAANAGLDLEMPTPLYFGLPLYTAVKANLVSMETINDKVSRILRTIFASGIYDTQFSTHPDPTAIGSSAHLSIAQKAAASGLVLLKNDNKVLPINSKQIRSIAVIGAGANFSRTGGGGSSLVIPTRIITPLKALNERLSGKNISVSYALGMPMNGDFEAIPASLWTVDPLSHQAGVKGEYFDNQTLSGNPVLTRIDPNIDFSWNWGAPDPKLPKEHFSVRWTGYVTAPLTTTYAINLRCDDGARLWVNDQLLIDAWHDQAVSVYTAKLAMIAGHSYKIRMEYYQNTADDDAGLGMAPVNESTDMQEAIALAAKSDVAVVFAGLSAAYEGEGMDRSALGLPEGQDDLIEAIAKANPNTIVVINAGNPVLMPWLSAVKGVLYAWYGGQEAGYAIADALLGNVNPSGKLPVSFPKSWQDASAYGAYPEDAGTTNQVTYKEGIYVGYRHFDTHNIEPLFPFGFGLSYTNFAYSNLSIHLINQSISNPKVEVSFAITNTGKIAGAEVAQLYVSEKNPVVDRPKQELKGFKKVFLQAGETKNIVLPLDAKSFSYYDAAQRKWLIHPDTFEIKVGSSSRDVKLSSHVELQ